MSNEAARVAGKTLDLHAMAQLLVASGQYKVLRRLEPRPSLTPPAGVSVKTALFLDVETTGLDPMKDEVIELAMVPFTYGPDGRIYEVKEAFQRFWENKFNDVPLACRL